MDFVYLLILIFVFVTAYIESLYSTAVYVDPEEIETILPRVSSMQQVFLKRLSGDPRALIQTSEIYKSFALIVLTVISILLAGSIARSLGIKEMILQPIGLVFVWGLYILVVEVLPRQASRTAISSGRVRHLWIAYLVFVVFYPIVQVYRRLLSRSKSEERVSEGEKEEIVERAIADVAERAGIAESLVDEEEREMINQIFLLDQTTVREIMIPRINVVGIEKSMTFRQIRELVVRDGHSRYPVFEETIDKIIGMIYVKDLFNNMPEPGEKFNISDYLRQPYLIPETKIIGELLREFKIKRQHIALVVDEYGGVAGLVTLEDIIEEIFGEIQDEHDWEEDAIVKLDQGEYLVNANLLVEKLQDYLDTEYEQGDYDTVGGLIYDLVGSVPSEGQRIKWFDLEFEIDRVDGQRVQYVRVRR